MFHAEEGQIGFSIEGVSARRLVEFTRTGEYYDPDAPETGRFDADAGEISDVTRNLIQASVADFTPPEVVSYH